MTLYDIGLIVGFAGSFALGWLVSRIRILSRLMKLEPEAYQPINPLDEVCQKIGFTHAKRKVVDLL